MSVASPKITFLCIPAGIVLAGCLVGTTVNAFHPHALKWDGSNSTAVAGIREALAPIPGVQRSVSDEEVKAAITQGTTTLVDARSAQDFTLGHLPTAVSIPSDALNAKIAERAFRFLIPGQTIIIYCDRKTCPSASRTAKFLIANGFTNVFIYPDGWLRLKTLDLPRESGPWVE